MHILTSNYDEAVLAIYEHVGFKEDWVIYPIEDRTNDYWQLESTEVVYGYEKEDVAERNGKHYSAEIYRQRFYDKWVYRGKELTMVFADTHTDGMKYFMIFDNDKEVH